MKNENRKPTIRNIVVKTILFFIILNLIFIFLGNSPYGKISLYNFIFPGRERFPFSETPSMTFSSTMTNTDAMIASHKIAGQKKGDNEYWIVILGDSSIWGFLQKPEDTLSGLLENNIDFHCKGKEIKVFNLGYPSLSVLKDLVFLEKVEDFKPDLVLWFVTLESMIANEQMQIPLVENNPVLINSLIKKFQLSFSTNEIKILDNSIIKQKRNLADLIRHQLYGILWAGSGIDQVYPQEINPAQRDFEPDATFKGFEQDQFDENDLAADVILNAADRLSKMEFIVINEPILISSGKNSDIRYNFYYPRWAYDKYRNIIKTTLTKSGILYYDFWNLVPESEFTNSAIHLNLVGERILANKTREIIKMFCQ